MFEFAHPAWLLLLALVPLWWWWTRPTRGNNLLVPGGSAVDAVATWRWSGAIIEAGPRLFRALALVLLILALCRPQLVRTWQERVNQGLGVVIAVDLSTSMLAEDMAEGSTRLEVAKATILRFLKKRTDDVGLVVFAGEAMTRLPPTSDRSVAQAVVAELEIGLLRDGTDIAGATAAAGGLFRDTPYRDKVLILVTDGAHNKPGLEPAQAARAAAAHGVKIFAIAIGGQKAEDAGTQAMETVLAQTARITGGQYFRATDVATLDRIYAEIDRTTSSAAANFVERTSFITIVPWFLAATALALLAGLVLKGSRWGVIP